MKYLFHYMDEPPEVAIITVVVAHLWKCVLKTKEITGKLDQNFSSLPRASSTLKRQDCPWY